MMTAADWDRQWKRSLFAWTRKGNRYADGARSTYARWISGLLEGIDLKGRSSIELGCGTGLVTRELYDVFGLSSGVLLDFSVQALAVARANAEGRKIRVVQADLLGWNTAEQFDLALSIGLVEHFQGNELAKVVQKHAEALRPGGHAVILMPRRGILWPALKVFNRLQGIREVPPEDKELVALCEQSGLKVLRQRRFPMGVHFGVLGQKSGQ